MAALLPARIPKGSPGYLQGRGSLEVSNHCCGVRLEAAGGCSVGGAGCVDCAGGWVRLILCCPVYLCGRETTVWVTAASDSSPSAP